MHGRALMVVLLTSCLWAAENKPSGIRLRKAYPVTDERIMLTWGQSKADVEAAVAIPNAPIMSTFSCVVVQDVEVCSVPVWAPDFGDPDMVFPFTVGFCGGKFCSYEVTFPASRFDFIYGALESALGKPSARDETPTQNRMGATFDQSVVRWQSETTLVLLSKRSDKIDTGKLTVLYGPLAATVKQRKAQAPF